MVYHLALPRQYAAAGGMVPTDDNIFASFPLGFESILSIFHALGEAPEHDPPFNPRLIGAWVSLGAAMATVGLTRIIGVGDKLAIVAGAAMLLVPTWMEFGASCYVEPYLVLLSTLSLCCACRLVGGEERAGLPMAILLGLAAGVKYPGLGVLGFVLMLVLVFQLKEAEEQGGDLSRVLALWASLLGLTLVMAAPFYMRNLVERGNPVFPLVYGLFGGEGWDLARAQGYSITLEAYGQGRGLSDYLLLPIRLFTTTDMKAGFQGSIGPLPLVLILMGAWRVRSHRDQVPWMVLAFGLAWALFWALNVQQVRFFLVGLSPLLALGVWGIAHRPVGELRVGLGLTAVGMLIWASGPLQNLWKHQDTGAWLQGEVSDEQVLDKVMPWTWRPYQELEAYVPEDGRIWLVHTRAHTYYLHRDYRLDCVFEEWRFVEALATGEGTAFLESELHGGGFTHLLINRAFFLSTVENPSEAAVLYQRFLSLLDRGILVEQASWKILEGEPGDKYPMVLYRVADLESP
jgi:hypothetical protein